MSDVQAVSRMAYSSLFIKTSSAAKVSEELAPVEHTIEPCKEEKEISMSMLTAN